MSMDMQPMLDVLGDVRDERKRQHRKWGEQNHRDADPVSLDRTGGATPERLADHLEIPTEARAKYLCAEAVRTKAANWAVILVEEVAEAVAAIGNDQDLRDELVQVAAVAVAWIEAIDRRRRDAERS